MQEVVRYTYRLRPGALAERALTAEWHRCRYLWNEAVHQRRIGRKPTRTKVGKLLTVARAANTWLREGSQNAQACMLETWALANKHSQQVRGRNRPAVKKRHTTRPSLAYTRNGFAIVDGRLRLPKGVTIPVVWSRELPSEPTSVRVYRDSLGHWYASFVVRRDTEPAPAVDGSIGIDWGIGTPATTTDPAYDLPYHGHRRRCAAELAKAQRRLARRRRPTCHRCFGRTNQRLGLAERTFSCRSCGYTGDRDENAARTILAVAERGGTSVDDVRHALTSSPMVVAGAVQSELEIPLL